MCGREGVGENGGGGGVVGGGVGVGVGGVGGGGVSVAVFTVSTFFLGLLLFCVAFSIATPTVVLLADGLHTTIDGRHHAPTVTPAVAHRTQL